MVVSATGETDSIYGDEVLTLQLTYIQAWWGGIKLYMEKTHILSRSVRGEILGAGDLEMNGLFLGPVK